MREFSGAQGLKKLLLFSARTIQISSVLFLVLANTASAQSISISNSVRSEGQHTVLLGPGQPVQVEGELEIINQDFKDGRHNLVYSLKRPDGTHVPLKFIKEAPVNLHTGDHVQATGQMSGGSLILYSGSTTTTTTSMTAGSTTPLANTFGAQSTLVILVSFQDAPANQPFTPAQVQNEVFGSSGTSGFLQEASYGQTWLTGGVYGWYVIPVNSAACDTNQIATNANSAASAAGVDLAPFSRFVYVFPYTTACAWAGAASIGGNPSQSWINGGGTTTNTLDLGIFSHELGHNLGLFHSHGLDCGTVIFGGQCTVWEYFDSLDVMGSGQGHYNSFQKERLGWLNYGASPPITTVTSSGTYTLAPYESNDSNSKALKVLKFTNPTTGLSYYYYIEYRQPLGFDSFISSMAAQNMTNGVVIHLAQDGVPNSIDLLNMTPKSSTYFDWNDVALAVGTSYSDPDAGVTITTQSAGSQATVNISTGQASCVRALPSVSLSSSQVFPVPAGTTVTYTVTVLNNDSSNCGASTFTLQPSIAYGWTDTLSDSQLTTNPGTTASTSFSVTSAANSTDGTNPVSVNATSASDFVYSAAASANYSVGVPSTTPPPTSPSLTISVAVAGSSFVPPGAVPISAVVTNNGAPASGTTVTFLLTTPSGSVTKQTATTGSNGVAVWSYKLSGRSQTGTYSVVSQIGGTSGTGGGGGRKTTSAAAASALASSNTATFSVQ